MNTIAALGRRVRAAYKPRGRRNRASKMRKLRMEIEKARRTTSSPIASQTSTAELAPVAGNDENIWEREPDYSSARPNRPQFTEDDIPGRFDDAEDEPPTWGVRAGTVTTSRQIKDKGGSQATASRVDAVNEQAIREQKYIAFRGEDADDYTYGPVRILDASDGVKTCAALLLTLDFSARVQRAVQAQRAYARSKRSALGQLEVAMRFEGDLDREISHHRRVLMDFDRGTKEDPVKEASLREELDILEQMLEGAKVDRQCTSRAVESKASSMRRIQAEAIADLEDAFIYARLLEPEIEEPNPPVEDRDLQEEYQKFRQRMQDPGFWEPITPLDVSRERPRPPPLSAEEQARQDLVRAFWKAHDRVMEAQNAFDGKKYWRSVEWQARYHAIEHGEEAEDATTEAFDLRWLRRGQELTHELLQAEEAFAIAKANALEAGLDLAAGDQLSASIDDGEGDQMNLDEERVPAGPEPWVTNWLTFVSSPVSPSYNEQNAVTDEWESAEVDISDSLSAVAEGDARRRIDEWRRACNE